MWPWGGCAGYEAGESAMRARDGCQEDAPEHLHDGILAMVLHMQQPANVANGSADG